MEILLQEAASGPHQVHALPHSFDREEIYPQGVAGHGSLDADEPGGAPFDGTLVEGGRVPPALEGVPGLHHELLTRGYGDGGSRFRVQGIDAFVLGQALH